MNANSHLNKLAQEIQNLPVEQVQSTCPQASSQRAFPRTVLFTVFVVSGSSALLYQMVWQRSLLNIYGSNVESVAMVVAAFLAGLGFGSLLGGHLSSLESFPLITGFACCELGAGAYGLVSLDLFRWAGAATTIGSSPLLVGCMAFALVFLPTLLMGATLPMLVEHQVRATMSVGSSVSLLYCVNTLGGAIGALVAVHLILGSLGMSGTVRLAAMLNLLVALVVLVSAKLMPARNGS